MDQKIESSARSGGEKSNQYDLKQKINNVTKPLSKPYFNSIFIKLLETNRTNAEILYNYIIAEQTELNIKNSTVEGKIKVLVWLSNFHNTKSFLELSKHDIVGYLNSLRKSPEQDVSNKWIGTYNGRQIILQKFFRWLYSPDLECKDRPTPVCMKGVRKLPRREKTPYKPADIWNTKEHAVFLKYCPNKRDRCYHALARDMSARPHEILGLRLEDIQFNISDEGLHYAEARITNGKTGPRTTPLTDSLPYLKEWIQTLEGKNPTSYIFISVGNNYGSKLSLGGLSSQYKHYKVEYFPSLLLEVTIPDEDKSIIKKMLSKPWNLYIFRHSALTEKSQILSESVLKDHAGWTMSSKMVQTYIHLNGESSKIILKKKGILKDDSPERMEVLKSKLCPNCNEPNKPDSFSCVKCKMILTFEKYTNIVRYREKEEKEMELFKNEIESKFRLLFSLLDYNKLKNDS